MIVEPGKTYIGKVRATSNERDTLALRIRLSSMLSTINLHPPGLPRSAIVCIRKFHDPLPGSLRLQNSSTRPPSAWEQAVQASLKQLVERAVYAARDAVPLNADVVIFTDQAEMLACLARDWCAGNITGRWWWQGLFRGKDIGQLLVPTWLNTPEYIPAALQRLATMGKANVFVRALGDNDARTMLQSVIRSFGLYELQFLRESVAKEPVQSEPVTVSKPQLPAFSHPTGIQRESAAREAFVAAQPTGHAGSAPENPPVQQPELQSTPWQPWVSENTGSELSLERQCLLGIGLMLARAPAVVRSASFARATQQWWSAEQHVSYNKAFLAGKGFAIEDAPAQQHTKLGNASASESPREAPVMYERVRDTRVESPLSEDETGGKGNTATSLESMQFTVSEATELSFQRTQLSVSESLELALEDTRVPISHSEIAEPAFEDTQVPVPLSETEEPSLALNPLSVPGAMPTAANRRQPCVVELFEAEIETELGGLFYLINLGLFLNLYGDFTTPLQPGIYLSIWDFITMLGQQLLGSLVKADPVWGLLAQLAGRSEQDLPGEDFDPPESWRMPAEWLESFPGEGPWCWNIDAERLQVQHTEQFLVLDLPLEDDDVEEQLKCEMQEFADLWYSEVVLEHDLIHRDEFAAVAGLPPGVERWLGWLMPYVRVRLQRALGLLSADDVPHILCKHAARIILTATHLDIVLSLAALPIEVRLSGLDRNPGWVPAAGRFVAFHFE